MEDIAIRVSHLSKIYKLYDKPMDRLKDSLGLTRKQLYKNHYALSDVDMEVKKGETVGIIGTNGSGKSTILKIITGVLNQTEGEVVVNGRISALLELGAGFNQEYTGIENIYLNGTMIGFSKEEVDARLDDIVSFADIGEFINQPVKSYSSGMFVRLAFAVAINIDPEILIVDEALSVGDVFFQNKCYHKFEEFKKQGKTILFVSHDLGSISKYCDRVVLLNKGVKKAEGSPQEMVDLYKKIMVGLDEEDTEEQNVHSEEVLKAGQNLEQTQSTNEENNHFSGTWKEHLAMNPNVNEYGNGKAEIVDVGIFDENGIITSSIMKNSTFKICTKVHFKSDISDPIFTYTFKTVRGTDVTGTNTMYEKVSTGGVKKGDVYIASFTQDMNLQGGEYLLSVSCTGFEGGEFVAYHRLYDAVNITVISEKNTVGYYDMNSKVKLQKVEK